MLSPNRIVWLDYSKAIAIVLVVLFHSGLVTAKVTSPLLAICIPLFFMTNGALVLKKNRRVEYYLIKVLKILFLYLFWGSVSSVSTMLIKGEAVTLSKVMNYVLGLRMGYAHIYWFLCTLITMYCIYPAIQSAVKTHDGCSFLLIASFLFSFKLFGYRIPLFHVPNILAGWEAECVFYAICGYAVMQYISKENKICNIFVLMGIFVCVYVFQLLMYSPIPFFSNHTPESIDDAVFSLYKSPCIMLMTAVVFIVLKISKLPQSRLVQIIGENTLGIYVTHGLFMKVFLLFLSFNSLFVRHLVLFVFSLMLSLLFSYLMSFNKYTRFFVSL